MIYKPYRNTVLQCGKYNLNLGTRTFIMGILNVTPDSFSDGGDFVNIDVAIEHAKKMAEEGADIIDIGGESTRPGHAPVSAALELERIMPVLKRLIKEVDKPISVDTYKAEVALEALKAGAHLINDVWGLQKDPDIAKVIGTYHVPVIIMHNQDGTEYKNDMIYDMKSFFQKSIDIALKNGIKSEEIVLDPGIGFGKDLEQNKIVMTRLSELNDLGYPLLLGTSRKSLIGKILDLPPKARLEGTIATTVMGIIQGVDIIRVHDVTENLRAAVFTDALVRGSK